jgi:hypothetical protein
MLSAAVVAPALSAEASSPKPTITSFSATPTLPPQGGTLTLSAVVTNGRTCTYSVVPKLSGFPKSLDCTPSAGTTKRNQHVAVAIPSNATGLLIHYSWSLVVRASGSTAKWGSPVKTVLESFHISRQQVAVNLRESPLAISCSGKTFCMTVGKLGSEAIMNGKFVKRSPLLDGGRSLTDVSCASPKMCVVIDNAGNYLVWDGSHMSGAHPLYDNGTTTKASVTSVSCPVVSFCMVVGDGGEAFAISGSTSTDRTAAGHAWNNAPRSVSCSSATQCVVVDVNGNGYSWDGKSWSTSLLISSAGFGPVSCLAGSSVCVAVDRAGYAWSLTPPVPSSGSWSTKKLGGKLEQVVIGARVSCASKVYCQDSDGNGGLDQIVGGSVGLRIVFSNGKALIGPSCTSGGIPSKMICTSVSSDGKTKMWSTPVLLK